MSHRHNKDFAVAHSTTARECNQLFEHFFDSEVFDVERDLDFGQESFAVFAFLVLIQIAFLATEPFDFGHANRFDRRSLQARQDRFGKVRTDDRTQSVS